MKRLGFRIFSVLLLLLIQEFGVAQSVDTRAKALVSTSEASASVTAGGNGSLDQSLSSGGLVGFQFGVPDNYYISAYASLSGIGRVTGGQKNFGAFLRNPPTSGTSFYTEDNKLFELELFGVEMYLGPAISAGVTLSRWEDGASAVEGTFFYLDTGLLVSSRTAEFTVQNSLNTLRWGVELDYSGRLVGGDLSHSSSDAFIAAPTVLGTKSRGFSGVALVPFFVLNTVKAYARVSWFGPEEILGLSGFQGMVGVQVQTDAIKLLG